MPEALDIVLNHFNTYELQQKAFKIVKFKLDVLWTMLDYMYLAYGAEGMYERDNLMLILGAHFATLNSNELIDEFRKN